MTTPSGGTLHSASLRGTRYGEILLIRGEVGQLTAAVYTTAGLNDCPLDKWRSLDPQKLAKDFGVLAVYLNGPRFWLMDQIRASTVGETLSFGGLEAHWVAEVAIPPELNVTDRGAGGYYRDVVVKRETVWIFSAGRPVYELLTADGKTYVMQAYSHIIDDSLTEESLSALGGRLRIPEGWQYRVRIPGQDLMLPTVGGEAHVLQDEMENTYMQLVTA